MTKIVVTGALGHIGSALVRFLPYKFPGAEIVLIDNLSTLRYCSLFNLPREARFRFHEADVTNDPKLDSRISGADCVVHLAAITDATSSFENREEVERVNLTATARVAEACVTTGAKLVHMSSTSVYGSQSERVDETCADEDLRPQSPYAETKLKEEKLIRALNESEGLNMVTLRLGTIFGYSIGMRFHTAVNKFCWQAVMGEPLTVWRTAYDQMRPYLGLPDACRAVTHAIENDLFDGRVYNVVSENATVRRVIDAVRKEIPDVALSFVDSRIMNQLSYEVGAQRIAETGFRPACDLASGIEETIAALAGCQRSD